MTDPAASCPDTAEVALLCTQLNTAEAENARLKAYYEQELDRVEHRRADYEDRYETSHASRMWAEECFRRAEAERDALRAAVDAALAIIDDWASDDTQIKLVTLPARIGAVLNRATAGVPEPTEDPHEVRLNGWCIQCGTYDWRHPCAAAGPVVALPNPTEEQK